MRRATRPRRSLPCDPAQISRLRRALGAAGVEQVLKTTIEAAVAMNAARPKDFERVIVDATVQEAPTRLPGHGLLRSGGVRQRQSGLRRGRANRSGRCDHRSGYESGYEMTINAQRSSISTARHTLFLFNF